MHPRTFSTQASAFIFIVPGIQMQQGGYQGIGTSGHHHGIAGIEHAGSHGAGLAEKFWIKGR